MMYINKADLLNTISTQIQYNTEKPLESYTKLLNTINNFEGIDISGRLLDERQVYTVLINAYSITSADERVKLLETLNSIPTAKMYASLVGIDCGVRMDEEVEDER